jgi:hypothetical protein
MRKSILVVFLAALAFVPMASAATPHSGLYGVVHKGPIMPVCRADVPCDAPAQVTLVFTRAGKVVARARSDAEGRYRVALPAGYYVVRTNPRIGFGVIRPLNVHVRKGHFDRLNFSIDTGIR